MYMTFAASARDGLRLKRQHREIIGETTPARDRIEALEQPGILRGDAGRVTPLVVVVISTGSLADLAIFLVEMGRVVAKGDQRRGAD